MTPRRQSPRRTYAAVHKGNERAISEATFPSLTTHNFRDENAAPIEVTIVNAAHATSRPPRLPGSPSEHAHMAAQGATFPHFRCCGAAGSAIPRFRRRWPPIARRADPRRRGTEERTFRRDTRSGRHAECCVTAVERKQNVLNTVENALLRMSFRRRARAENLPRFKSYAMRA